MNPITGPFDREIGAVTTGPSMLYDRKIGYKQVAPHNLPLAYTRELSRIIATGGKDAASYDPFGSAYYNGSYYGIHCNFRSLQGAKEITVPVSQAKNQIFEKTVKQLDEKAELLVSLVERRETLAMMEKRLVDLYRFVKAFRHPTPKLMRQFFTGSSLPRPARQTLARYLRNWRQISNDLGKAWLEFHFGWEPLVKDIDTCLQLASRPLSEASVHVNSRKLPWRYDGMYQTWSKDTTVKGSASGYVRASGTCVIQVDNPKKVYQSVLGLNNQVLVGYALIPFSWMFDWVNYLGSYISQFSDLTGYKILNASHSWKVMCVGGVSEFRYPGTYLKKSNVYSGVVFIRALGIPAVTLTWRPLPSRASVSRGLTSASLLAQMLSKKFVKAP